MKISTHTGGRRVTAEEVRAVLKFAKPYTASQWAEFFRTHERTVERWKAGGLRLDLWSGPTTQQWKTLKDKATQRLWKDVSFLEGCK